ncbi:MAG TPA: asparagine synthase (glutamine-hydrolyzing) [bacterium]|nr:asparagine synthase (glutamine-hydrolyzing) [bacterium]
MCGINGFNWNDEVLIKKMNEVVKNRGPDDEGFLCEDITLGHTRLSIIDLSPRGHQPMANEDDTIWITYNGEIYNYKELREDLIQKGHLFKSKTDTEVIIHAYEEYGLNCIEKFNGMWAFCIYDRNTDKLILNRDRYGIKPLYYYMDGQRIIFSSMIAGILCHNIETAQNDKAIMEYLAHNLEDHDTYTFFRNIHKLQQGNMLIYDLGTKRHDIRKWYNPVPGTIKDEDYIRKIFSGSVQWRTVSDVPVGSCLSGGIDSSAIVCLLDRVLQERFNTFSLIVPGNRIDESSYIKEVGKKTDTQQFYITVDTDDFIDEIEDFVRAQEEPVTELSPYAQYRVMKLAHENNARVLLDGQGGDEIFAGYIYYFGYYFYELFTGLKWLTLVKEMVLYAYNSKNIYPHALFVFLLLPGFIQTFLWKTCMNRWIDHSFLKKVCGNSSDPRWKKMNLEECLKMTLFSTAIPHLLRFEDKNSMRWSVESRVPFLDFELVESALSLPSKEKLHDGKSKVIFKRAMHSILPEMIRNRTDKIGFGTPINEFFRNEKIVKFCEVIVNSDSFKNRPYWKWKRVEKMFRDHVKGRKNAGKEIWKWINTEIWLRMFFDKGNAS